MVALTAGIASKSILNLVKSLARRMRRINGKRRSASRNGGFYTPEQSAEVAFVQAEYAQLAAGCLTADEVYYLNPTLKAGFFFLYWSL